MKPQDLLEEPNIFRPKKKVKHKKVRFATFDYETDPFSANRVPEAFAAGWYDGETYEQAWGTEKYVSEFLLSKMEAWKGLCFAHNFGKFDAFFLLKYLEKMPELFTIHGRIVKAQILGSDCRDSYSFLPVPLKAHQKTEISYDKFERNVRDKHRKEIQAYLQDDNVYLHEFITKFIARFGLGLTLANRAFSELKKLGVKLPRGNAKFDKRFRDYYFGGRVQCFEKGRITGKPDLTMYDINSAYPYAMKHFKHCDGLAFATVNKLPKDDEKLGSCFATIEATPQGCLPFRDEKGKILFPVGKRGTYHVTGWEIIAGLKTNALKIHKVIECKVPFQTRNFGCYVDEFFRMKSEAEAKGDKTERLFAKLLLNSAYGRYGINPNDFKEMILEEIGIRPREYCVCSPSQLPWICVEETEDRLTAPDSWTRCTIEDINNYQRKTGKTPDSRLTVWKRMLPEYQMTYEGIFGLWALWEKPASLDDSKYYSVATAASITGCVRAYLWESLRKVNSPVYCDTDSIICQNGGTLETGTQLGQWKLECKGSEVIIAGKKLYCFSLLPEYQEADKMHKIASKGVKLSAPEFDRLAKGEEVEFTKISPTFSLKGVPKFITRRVRQT